MIESASSRRKGAERRKGNRREGFDRRMPERKFSADEYVFREGESAKLCYQIVSGKVGIYKNFHGETKEIVEFSKGDLFGEMALIDNSPRRASARAKEPTVLKQIHQRAFLDYLAQSPDTAMSIMKRLIAYARSSMDTSDADAISLAAKAFPTEDLPDLKSSHKTEIVNKQIIEDFQSPSENLLRQQLPKSITLSLISITVLLIATIIWTLNSEIEVTVSANGKLSSTVSEVPILNEVDSTLKSIDVSPGDLVKKGEIIATLSPTYSLANHSDSGNEEQLLLTSPLDGLIIELGGIYSGAKLEKDAKIATIVPTNLPLSIDLEISAEDLKRITIGNLISVKIPALPYLDHGDLTAELSYVPNYKTRDSSKYSPSAARSSKNIEALTYQAKAVIKSNNLRNLPDNFRLLPGMYVDNDIVIAKRTLLDYFLYPILDTYNRSFSEP